MRPGVGSFSSELAKVRKAIHKVIPRELSPTRLLEKFATDTKKKGAAKIAAVSDAAAAKQEKDDAVAVKQFQDIQRAAPVALPAALQAALPPAGAPVVSRVAAPDYTPYYVGGALLLGGVLLLSNRGSRR